MATWREVQERVRSLYKLDVDDPTELALTLERREEGAVRAQRVMVRRYDAWGREMVEIRSAFGAWGDYPGEVLLADNLNMPLGAVALHGNYLVLVQKACLADTSIEGVLWLIHQLGTLADLLEARGGSDRF